MMTTHMRTDTRKYQGYWNNIIDIIYIIYLVLIIIIKITIFSNSLLDN